MRLGVVADDVTGAADVADAVCDEGWSAALVLGVPEGPLPDADCVVVALKSRTAPAAEAVAASSAAARALLDAGAGLIYEKYCSTFDSTDLGNIGPVADALAEVTGARLTVGTPATPRVGRTVYQGHLFVGRQLLGESPLRDHPLTPMRESDLVRLLARQTPNPVTLLERAVLARGDDAVVERLLSGGGHVLADAVSDADLDRVARGLLTLAGRRAVVVAGAAGLAAALARASADGRGQRSPAIAPPAPGARRLVVSGSCSQRTREQVAAFAGPTIPLPPDELAADFDGTVGKATAGVSAAYDGGADSVLVSSTAAPERIATAPPGAAALLERAAGEIARASVAGLGVRRLLVAGGETSGAVVAALGLRSLRIGPSAGPGLPWLVPAGDDRLTLLLKSGNFGDADLFTTAWGSCP